MNNIKQLREARNEHARQARNLMDNNPGKMWSPAHQSAYDSHIESIERLDGEITATERSRAGHADVTVQDAIDTAYRERRAPPRDELTNAFIRQGESGFTADQKLAIRNTMSTTTGSQGGFSVPSLVASRFADLMKAFSGVRRVAEVLKTATGGPYNFPSSDGTAEVGERLAENAAASSLDPSFATASLQAWKYSSKIFTVPFELLQDSMLDVEGYVLGRGAERIGRVSNTDFTTGNGTGQPTGFTGAAGSGKVGTSGQTLTVIHDDLIDLVHSVNTAYRQIPQGLAFMMADTSFKVVRKLKDSSLRPLYLPSEDGTSPETILGYPVVVNDDVAAMAANAKSIFFGNWFRCYKVRDALEVMLLRMDDSAFAKLGQVGFIALARIGGNLVDANGVRFYQNSAT